MFGVVRKVLGHLLTSITCSGVGSAFLGSSSCVAEREEDGNDVLYPHDAHVLPEVGRLVRVSACGFSLSPHCKSKTKVTVVLVGYSLSLDYLGSLAFALRPDKPYAERITLILRSLSLRNSLRHDLAGGPLLQTDIRCPPCDARGASQCTGGAPGCRTRSTSRLHIASCPSAYACARREEGPPLRGVRMLLLALLLRGERDPIDEAAFGAARRRDTEPRRTVRGRR